MKIVGKIDIAKFAGIGGDILADEVIITDERMGHIIEEHEADFEIFGALMQEILREPDFVIADSKNENTAFVIKCLENTNLNIVLKLHVCGDNPDFKNSVLTFYRLRDSNLHKLKTRNKVVYKRE